ncbi:MAG: hypothetical protein NTV23_01020 [Propionibacteriales bacterium]|nr:hypothetical protein [Propionibacteriales bacterium]
MSLVVDSFLIGGVALELVGAGVLAHAHNAESIVALREEIGAEGTALGEPDAVATHATLLAEKRVGFVLLTVGLVFSLVGLVADSAKHVMLMSGLAAVTVLVGIIASIGVTRILGNRYQGQARKARDSSGADELPEQ